MKKIYLLAIILLLSVTSFSKNLVITSIQPLYSLTSYLVKGTDIEVKSVFGSDVSMDTSIEAFDDKELDMSIAKEAQAVVGLSRVWPDDKLYARARGENINIIEIEAATSFDGLTNMFITENEKGQINPYLWTSGKNIVKLATIITRDLSRIYPKEKAKIEKNLAKLNENIVVIDEEEGKKLIDTKEDSIIFLSHNLDYFINDLNIYSEYYDYNKITVDNIDKIMKDTGIKIIISDRWLKKTIIKKIEANGGKFVYIETLNIPLDKDGKMDEDAILKTYKENLEKMIKVLN